MGCKSLISVVNTGNQTVDANGVPSLGAIQRRRSCNMNLNGSNVTIVQPGYYKVDVSAVVEPTSAGPVTLTLLENGVPVPGGIATDTPVAAGDSVTLNINTPIIRVFCNGSKTLTLSVSAAATISELSMTVEEK